MFRKIAERVADRISGSGLLDGHSPKVYAYGMEMLLASLSGIATVLVFSLLFGEPLAGLVYYVAYAFLRASSGGYHAASHLKCYIISLLSVCAFFVLLRGVPRQLLFAVSLSFSLLSALVILILAPVGTPNKQLSEKERKKYRKKCRIILFVELSAVFALLALGKEKYAFAIANGFVLVAVSLVVGAISLKRYLRGFLY